jgi:hypothetical protein
MIAGVILSAFYKSRASCQREGAGCDDNDNNDDNDEPPTIKMRLTIVTSFSANRRTQLLRCDMLSHAACVITVYSGGETCHRGPHPIPQLLVSIAAISGVRTVADDCAGPPRRRAIDRRCDEGHYGAVVIPALNATPFTIGSFTASYLPPTPTVRALCAALNAHRQMHHLDVAAVPTSRAFMAHIVMDNVSRFAGGKVDIFEEPQFWEGAAAAVGAMRNVAALQLGDANLPGHCVEGVLAALAGQRRLKRLLLSGNSLGDVATVVCLLPVLRQAVRVARIDVSCCKITPETAAALAACLAEAPRLTWLDVGRNDLFNEGARAIAAALHWTPGLRHLGMAHARVMSGGAIAVAAALAALPRLAHLDFCPNAVGLVGQVALTDALRAMPHPMHVTMASEDGVFAVRQFLRR